MTNTQFGTVEHDGKTYVLTEQAFLSNRLFADCWSNATEGDRYTSEWQAHATADGVKCLVTWQFDAVRGQEPDDDSNWPWDDEHIVSVTDRHDTLTKIARMSHSGAR